MCLFVETHPAMYPFCLGTAALWIVSAAVSAMAPPGAASSSRYQYLYRFAHLLAANLDRAGLLAPQSTAEVTNEVTATH